MCIQDISNMQQSSKASLLLELVMFQILTSTVNICSYVCENQTFPFFRKPEQRLFLKKVVGQGQDLPYVVLERDINSQQGFLILTVNPIDQAGGAADFISFCSFPVLSSLKKPGWTEGRKGVYFIVLMDMFGSIQLVCVIHKVPLVPDVSKVVMAQHVKQPVVMCGRKIIVKIMKMIMQWFA